MTFESLKEPTVSADVVLVTGQLPAPNRPPEAGLLGRFIGWIRHRRTLATVADTAANRIPPTPGIPAPQPSPVPLCTHAPDHPHQATGGGWLELEQELSNLCRLWQNGPSEKVRQGARQRVMELLIPMAARLAGKYHYAATGLTRDDLQQEALLSLCGAMATYNPGHNVPFSAFARRRMHGAILDALRRWMRPASIGAVVCTGSAVGPPPATVETVDLVEHLLAGLSAPQRRVVELHFVAEMPRSRIAKLLGLHVSRVGQLLRQAMAALRTQPQADQLFC